MRQPKNTKLKLNKVKVSRIQNSSFLFGGSFTNPNGTTHHQNTNNSQNPVVSLDVTHCSDTLGAGEVTGNPIGTEGNQVTYSLGASCNP